MPRPKDDEMSESEHGKIPKSTYEIYRAEGDSQFRNKNFPKSIECYTQALELKPDDQYCLVNRSKCYLNEGNTAKALADAESSLKEDSTFYKGIYQKAEVLYFNGDFENALVFYHRGYKLRPEMEEFRLGIQKAEEAINNSVGDPSVVKLRSDGDLSFFYAAEEERKKKPATRSSYQKPKKEDDGPKRAQRGKAPPDSKTIRKTLMERSPDYDYLANLLREQNEMSRKTEISEKIKDLCIEGLNYLDCRSDFWQQEKPFYARKNSSKKRADSAQNQSSAAKQVVATLDEIEDKQDNNNHEAAIKQANRLLKRLDRWNAEELPNRPEVEANLHSLIGNSQLELEQYDESLKSHQRDLELGQQHDLEVSQARGKENIGRVYARRGQHAKAVEIWEERLLTAKTPLEFTWLYHEISRSYLELRQLEQAKSFAEKALESARKSEDSQWQLNSNVLLAQCEVHLENYSSAIGSFENALDFANELENRLAIDAIKRAIDDVNVKIVEHENQIEQQRQLEQQQQQQLEEEEEEEQQQQQQDGEGRVESEDKAAEGEKADQQGQEQQEQQEQQQ